MADEQNAPADEQRPDEGANLAQEGDAGSAPKESETSAQDGGVEDLPDWAQKTIKDLRSENARRRTEYREMADRYKDAKTPDEIDKIVSEYGTKISALERELTIAQHTADLTPELREFVTGDTEEEIKASVERVRAAFTANHEAPAPHRNPPSGGLDPSGDTSDMDPRALAREALAARAGNTRR